ncbi:glycogen synthase kinase-3 beta-like [Narcine bancroftii]|uniref:glycogen synthase kinase-3 beta-like n=1 Tax=Narcine bancroftii TaxID=1343680 RepID=UPI00383201FA
MCIRVCDMTVQRELHPVSHPPGLFNWTVPTLNYTISHVPRHPVTLTPGLPSLADIYSAGCVLAELLLGQLIFPRDSGVEQLVQTTKEKEQTMETSQVSTTIWPCSEEGWTIP